MVAPFAVLLVLTLLPLLLELLSCLIQLRIRGLVVASRVVRGISKQPPVPFGHAVVDVVSLTGL